MLGRHSMAASRKKPSHRRGEARPGDGLLPFSPVRRRTGVSKSMPVKATLYGRAEDGSRRPRLLFEPPRQNLSPPSSRPPSRSVCSVPLQDRFATKGLRSSASPRSSVPAPIASTGQSETLACAPRSPCAPRCDVICLRGNVRLCALHGGHRLQGGTYATGCAWRQSRRCAPCTLQLKGAEPVRRSQSGRKNNGAS